MMPHTRRAQGLSMVHSATIIATCSPKEPCAADVLKVVFPVPVVLVVVVVVVVAGTPTAAVVVAAVVAAGVAQTVVHFVVQVLDCSEFDIAKTTMPHITC